MDRFWERSYPPGVEIPTEYPKITVPELLEEAATKYSDRAAIIFEENIISYCQLLTMSRKLVDSLAGLGVGQGDRVALFMNNCPQFVISLFAVLRLGAIVVNNISPMCVERELEAIFRDNEVRTAIVDTSLWPKLASIQPKLPLRSVIFTHQTDLASPLLSGRSDTVPKVDLRANSFLSLLNGKSNGASILCQQDDVALFQLTGGSTGLPKAAMLTHRNLMSNVHQARSHLAGLQDSWEVSLANMPFIHIYGVTVGVLRALSNGWTIIIMPSFSVRGVLDMMTRYPITILHSVPILFSGLIDHLEKDTEGHYDFSKIKVAGCGAAPLPEKVFLRFCELTGVEVCQGYGLTENAPVVCSNHVNGPKKAGSVGPPLPGIDIKIVDPDDDRRELPIGETGELLVKGPQVMKGYYNQAEETAQTLRGGYLHTGDMAYMDHDGYVFLSGRKKDMVISGGYNIYPAEVDEVIMTHPKVADVCSIGIPDEYRGEVFKAYVVLRSGQQATAEEIVDYCKANLSKYKVPYRVELRKSLPRDQVAKVRRETLRREYLERYGVEHHESRWKIF